MVTRKKAAEAAEPQSKNEQVLTLLRRDRGACLEEITTLTKWQPHSARAALTGLRKKGHQLRRDKVDGVTRYFLAVGDAA